MCSSTTDLSILLPDSAFSSVYTNSSRYDINLLLLLKKKTQSYLRILANVADSEDKEEGKLSWALRFLNVLNTMLFFVSQK